MAQILDFLVQQWVLASALMVCVILLFRHESRKGGETLTPQQVVFKVNKEEAVIVDLRDSSEFQKGHIVDAINIPQAKLAASIHELDAYKDRPVILVCKIGQHSGAAGKQLALNGFENLSRLTGGMAEWQNSQLPVVSS